MQIFVKTLMGKTICPPVELHCCCSLSFEDEGDVLLVAAISGVGCDDGGVQKTYAKPKKIKHKHWYQFGLQVVVTVQPSLYVTSHSGTVIDSAFGSWYHSINSGWSNGSPLV
nr:hypothetical protein Iba_chr02bCG12350 [Ipomoea batatas]